MKDREREREDGCNTSNLTFISLSSAVCIQFFNSCFFARLFIRDDLSATINVISIHWTEHRYRNNNRNNRRKNAYHKKVRWNWQNWQTPTHRNLAKEWEWNTTSVLFVSFHVGHCSVWRIATGAGIRKTDIKGPFQPERFRLIRPLKGLCSMLWFGSKLWQFYLKLIYNFFFLSPHFQLSRSFGRLKMPLEIKIATCYN